MKPTNAPIVETLVDRLRYRARIAPDRRVFSFVPDDAGAEELGLTHLQLDRRARAIAAQLQERDATGERVLLLYPPGLEYISAFFGCLYAGAIAVPTYPPRRERDLPRIEALIADCGARFALTTEKLMAGNLRQVRLIATDTIS